jgi:hypothetical protein
MEGKLLLISPSLNALTMLYHLQEPPQPIIPIFSPPPAKSNLLNSGSRYSTSGDAAQSHASICFFTSPPNPKPPAFSPPPRSWCVKPVACHLRQCSDAFVLTYCLRRLTPQTARMTHVSRSRASIHFPSPPNPKLPAFSPPPRLRYVKPEGSVQSS